METSDSEYFESADEDFHSDEESVVSTKISSKSEINPKLQKEAALEINLKLKIKSSNTNNSLEELLQGSSKIEQSKDSLSNVASLKKEVLNTDHTEASNQSKIYSNKKPQILRDPSGEHLLSPTKSFFDSNNDSLICINPKNEELSGQSSADKNVEKKIDQPKNLNPSGSNILDSQTNLWEHNKEEHLKEHEDRTHSCPQSDNKLAVSKNSNNKEENTESSLEAKKKLFENDEVNWAEDKLKCSKRKEQTASQRTLLDKLNLEEDNLWGEDEIDWETKNCLSHKLPNQDVIDEDNLWENDDWEPIEGPVGIPEEKTAQPSTVSQASSGWGGWNGWDVTSLLNTATQGVSTLTSHVSQGLSTVIEGGMGIPDPEQMAKEDIQISKETDLGTYEAGPNAPQLFGLGNLVGSVSHITKFVDKVVISGGLDTLETIGKKTMEVLQEGDPGLKKKRAFLKLDSGKPVLSQVLREAKERAEKENAAEKEQHVVKSRKVKSYETLFDDYQGLVHLEALEMLSRLSNMKLQSFNESLSGEALKEMQETMSQVKELCELPENDEDQQASLNEIQEKIDSAVEDLKITVSYEKLLKCCQECESWVDAVSLNLIDGDELHQQAIESLAQTTALAVEQFHKIGELLLVKEHRSTADEADSLVQLTTLLKSLIVRQANKFTDKISSLVTDTKTSNELITNIFYEAANSSSYLQDAFQLLIPVLQVGAV